MVLLYVVAIITVALSYPLYS